MKSKRDTSCMCLELWCFMWKKLHFLIVYYMFKIIFHATRLNHILYTQIIFFNIHKVIYSLVRFIIWGSWRKSTIENNGLLMNLQGNQASYGNLQWYHSNSLIFLHMCVCVCVWSWQFMIFLNYTSMYRRF
jgi:hypothetical protein